jgi:2-keto-3-deoxy-6-phosphogluconate aldolase
VFPSQVFCPTGGVEPENIAEYLSAGADFVGIGGALVAVKHIEAGNREAIQAVARSVVAAVDAAAIARP